jgi:hypothetical protein
VCEAGTWNEIYNGAYRSAMKVDALVAKLKALESRYNARLEFIDKKVITFDIAMTIKFAIREFLLNHGKDSDFEQMKILNKKIRNFKKLSK